MSILLTLRGKKCAILFKNLKIFFSIFVRDEKKVISKISRAKYFKK